MAEAKAQYKWTKAEDVYGSNICYGGYSGSKSWVSPKLFEGKSETKDTPFLASRDNLAAHWFDLGIFQPQPYTVPYNLETLSTKDKGTTVITEQKKKYLHSYSGQVDAELYLTHSDEIDNETISDIVLLDGQVVAGGAWGRGGFIVITSAAEYKKVLDEYFKIKGFGANLPNMINNSNLPADVKARFRGLA